MKTINLYKFSIGFLILGAVGCTDLEIEETDSRFGNLSGDFSGVDADANLTNLYNTLRGQISTQENLYALTEVSSDEQLVPTRGTDWGDNGVWRNLHAHTWDSNHNFIKGTWNNFNQMIFNATSIIDSRSSPTEQQAAEAKFIRGYCMFQLLDLFGQVPFRTPDEGSDVYPSVMSRAEALDFVLNDLNEALPVLPTSGPSADLNKPTKAAVRFLLAKIYLNKHIYLGTETPASADMTEVVNLVNAIQADGFALQEGYFDLFTDEVNTETIYFTTSDVGPRIWNTLHYKQNSPDNTGGGWNGFTTLAEFYDLFEGDPNVNVPGSGQEERRGFVPTDGSHLGIGYGFLINQQYDATGAAMTDRPGNPLAYTKDLPGLLGNNEITGIRIIKYHPENGAFANHEVVFRYADAHLMKAEAIANGGTSSEDALVLVNQLRTLRGATPLASLSDQDILDERGRELYEEMWRRNDLIRFGQFTQPWAFKDNTEDFRVLYPIPATAIITNPNLVQNPGY
tara:strand:+ start:90106 stop:91635 length:1530 start_codon:yes stop_codon:yes gene_type:complete